MKAIEQYFHVVLFIMLYKVVLTFTSVDETLVCDHSNESYGAVLSCGKNHHSKFQFDPRIWSSRHVKIRVTSIKYMYSFIQFTFTVYYKVQCGWMKHFSANKYMNPTNRLVIGSDNHSQLRGL